jgi:cell division protein FtsB
MMVFVAAVILGDSLFGRSGLAARLRAQQEHRASVKNSRALRLENSVLLEEIHRLRTDPATIEAVARTELGLIRPDELLVVLSPIH